jgi:lipopolysaccharide transport system permease protein
MKPLVALEHSPEHRHRPTRLVDPARLLPIVRTDARRGSLLQQARELWSYRELIYFFVWRDIKIRYKQTVLGAGWAVIQPVMIMIVFTLLFGRLARLPSDGIPYPVFYFSALVPWLYFANALGLATNSIVTQQALIKKVYFPRLVLPIVAVGSGLVDFVLSFVVLLGIALFYGVVPGWSVILAPAYVLFSMVTALALGLWLAAVNAIYRDVRHAIPFVIQIWMFASPVVYSSTLVPEAWRWLYRLNPLAGAIEGVRWALTGIGTPFDVSMLASVVIVLLVGITGFFYFRKTESTVVDVV